jgi:predicted transcriptional regulator
MRCDTKSDSNFWWGARMGVVQDKSQISIRVPTEMIATFDRIATAIERDRTWVMVRAFKCYLENGEGRDLLQEAAGVESLDRGEGVDFDVVMNEVDEIIAKAKATKDA